jgi:ABC-type amino acid transport substrate-binding protein
VTFVGVLLFDGQGFMTRRDTGTLSALELDGKSVCALTGSTSADHARRYFDRHRMALDLRLFPDMKAATQGLSGGRLSGPDQRSHPTPRAARGHGHGA